MFLPSVFVKNRDTVKPALSGHLKILKTKVFKVDALWSPAGKGLTFWLLFVMSICDVVTFP